MRRFQLVQPRQKPPSLQGQIPGSAALAELKFRALFHSHFLLLQLHFTFKLFLLNWLLASILAGIHCQVESSLEDISTISCKRPSFGTYFFSLVRTSPLLEYKQKQHGRLHNFHQVPRPASGVTSENLETHSTFTYCGIGPRL